MVSLPKTPSFKLHNKRALITGATSGIGLGGAAALAEAGAHVTLVARNQDQLEQTQELFQKQGFLSSIKKLDVTDIEAVQNFIHTEEPFDILFNNAGTNEPTAFIDVTPEQFDKINDLNSKAAFFVSQAVSQKMVHHEKSGSIIHTSSQMGHVGGLDRSVYCQTKFGIEGLTKTMALELAAYNIRVNTICPTFIRTPMTQTTFENAERLSWLTEKIKLNRIGEIEDIMGAVVFLASDASALITGSSIVIDGGWTAD